MKSPLIERAKARIKAKRKRDEVPQWVLMPVLRGSICTIYKVGASWELEKIDFGDGDPGDWTTAIPTHTHERQQFDALEAAIDAANEALAPSSILSLCWVMPGETEAIVRTFRLLPERPGVFYVMRLDTGLDAIHYHDEVPTGPYSMAEAMDVAQRRIREEARPPVCPCVMP